LSYAPVNLIIAQLQSVTGAVRMVRDLRVLEGAEGACPFPCAIAGCILLNSPRRAAVVGKV